MIYATLSNVKKKSSRMRGGKGKFKNKSKKKMYNTIKTTGLVFNPTTKNVTVKPIYSDNILKQMSSIENRLDEVYKMNYSPDIRNYFISSLMRKLENLENFRKRKQGGIYRISRPPMTPFKPQTPPPKGKKVKKELLPNSDDDYGEVVIEPVETARKTPKQQKKRKKIVEFKNKGYNLRTNPKRSNLVSARGFKLIKWG